MTSADHPRLPESDRRIFQVRRNCLPRYAEFNSAEFSFGVQPRPRRFDVGAAVKREFEQLDIEWWECAGRLGRAKTQICRLHKMVDVGRVILQAIDELAS